MLFCLYWLLVAGFASAVLFLARTSAACFVADDFVLGAAIGAGALYFADQLYQHLKDNRVV